MRVCAYARMYVCMYAKLFSTYSLWDHHVRRDEKFGNELVHINLIVPSKPNPQIFINIDRDAFNIRPDTFAYSCREDTAEQLMNENKCAVCSSPTLSVKIPISLDLRPLPHSSELYMTLAVRLSEKFSP